MAKGFLELPHGIPSHDTFRRVFAVLDPEQYWTCFAKWIQAVDKLTEGQIVAADGRALRRSHDQSEGKRALQMVSAWTSANGVVLAQRRVDDESNGITAVPELLDTLAISGCIVTLDAIHCQTETVETIVEKQAANLFRSRRTNLDCLKPCKDSSTTLQKGDGSSVTTTGPWTKAMVAWRFASAGAPPTPTIYAALPR